MILFLTFREEGLISVWDLCGEAPRPVGAAPLIVTCTFVERRVGSDEAEVRAEGTDGVSISIARGE
jgi:hypothetical protein